MTWLLRRLTNPYPFPSVEGALTLSTAHTDAELREVLLRLGIAVSHTDLEVTR